MKRVVSIFAILLLAISASYLAAETVPGSSEYFLQQGNKMLEQGKYKEAVLEFSNAIDLKEAYIEAYMGRGIAYYRLRQFANAINDFSYILGKNPTDYLACFWRARTRMDNGDFKMALSDIDRSLSENAEYPLSHVVKCDILMKLNDYQAALVSINKAIGLMGFDLEMLLKRIDICTILRNNEMKEKDCREIIAKLPEFFQAFYLLGDVLHARGEFAEAERWYTAGVELDPWKNRPDIQVKLAFCEILDRRYDSAVGRLRSVISVVDNKRPIHVFYFVTSLLLADRKDEVLTFLKKVPGMMKGIIKTEEYEVKWQPIYNYLIGKVQENNLVDLIIMSLNDKNFCETAYYAIAISNLCNGKKNRALDCLFKVQDLGNKGNLLYSQSKVLYNLLNNDKYPCPPEKKIIEETAPQADPEKPAPEKTGNEDTPKEEAAK